MLRLGGRAVVASGVATLHTARHHQGLRWYAVLVRRHSEAGWWASYPVTARPEHGSDVERILRREHATMH